LPVVHLQHTRMRVNVFKCYSSVLGLHWDARCRRVWRLSRSVAALVHSTHVARHRRPQEMPQLHALYSTSHSHTLILSFYTYS